MGNSKLALLDPQSMPPHPMAPQSENSGPNAQGCWRPWITKMELFWDQNRRGKYFYWPDVEERKSLNTQRRVKLEKITCSWPLASIALEFSNGVRTRTEGNKYARQESVLLNNRKRIASVEAKFSQGKCLNIILTSEDGELVSLNPIFKERNDTMTEKRFIPAGQEIVGYFGVIVNDYITCLGFYIWRPNPDAVL